MSVNVSVRGPIGSVEFEQETIHIFAEAPWKTAEVFAQVIEDMAKRLRLMYPPPAETPNAEGKAR